MLWDPPAMSGQQVGGGDRNLQNKSHPQKRPSEGIWVVRCSENRGKRRMKEEGACGYIMRKSCSGSDLRGRQSGRFYGWSPGKLPVPRLLLHKTGSLSVHEAPRTLLCTHFNTPR